MIPIIVIKKIARGFELTSLPALSQKPLFSKGVAFLANTTLFRVLNMYEITIDGKVLMLKNLILPAITLGIRPVCIIMLLTRSSILDVLSQDYIRTAFAKGLSEKRVIWIHALRNSLIPIASGIGYILATIIAGSYFIELIFNINGFGKMGYQAILDRDYPITMGFLVIVVIIRLLANLLSDLTLAAVDPRIRFK